MATPDARPIRVRPAERLVLERMPGALLDEPLEYIFADHFRQRSLCAALKRYAAEGSAPPAEARDAVSFLTQDLDWHHHDEDDDLFPALARRALPEDDLDLALARLEEDHRRGVPMVRAIVEALAAEGAGDRIKLGRAARDVMRAYAASEHLHLAIENGIVLAIARIRLTRRDLAAISASMKARRAGAA